ncbi:hypothetical protein ACQP3J_30135, partial [Escherichia coli]
ARRKSYLVSRTPMTQEKRINNVHCRLGVFMNPFCTGMEDFKRVSAALVASLGISGLEILIQQYSFRYPSNIPRDTG